MRKINIKTSEVRRLRVTQHNLYLILYLIYIFSLYLYLLLILHLSVFSRSFFLERPSGKVTIPFLGSYIPFSLKTPDNPLTL